MKMSYAEVINFVRLGKVIGFRPKCRTIHICALVSLARSDNTEISYILALTNILEIFYCGMCIPVYSLD